MSSTPPLVKPAGRLTGAQPRWPLAAGALRRYAVHLALLAVAMALLLVGRMGPWLQQVSLGLPSARPQVVITAPPPPAEQLPAAPVATSTIVPDMAVRRVAMPHTFEPELPTHDFAQHFVEKGDTPNGVAEKYGIEPATLLWSNPNLSDESQLFQVGITLTIPPLNGVLHTVVASDTVESIADTYGADPQAIIDYADNHLDKWPHRPVPGTQLLIPGGEQPLLVWTYTPNSPRGRVTTSSYYEAPAVWAGIGRFIWPTWGRITQYYWWAHRAIDIAGPIERPVAASDSGTVVFAGWSPVGYGYLVVIDHANGFQTYYAHLNSIWVASGQFVGQGMNIGGLGSTGNSTGPHLHFEIRYNGILLNPLDYLQ